MRPLTPVLPTAAVLVALPLAFPARAETAPALNEDEAVLLQPNLGPAALADTITVYPVGDGALVPFGEVCRLLSFGIRVDAELGRAEGFFISDERKFALDLGKGTADVEGKTLAIAPLKALVHNREIFVDTRLLEAWFPMEVKVDLKGALLTFKSKEKLPLELQWDREGRYAGLSGSVGGGEGTPTGQSLRDPYQAFDLPFMDLAVSWGRSQHVSPGEPQLTAALAGDLLWMSSSIFITRDSKGRMSDSRFTLYREDPRADLLGPLNARRVELGDLLQSPSLDLAGDLPGGQGALVDNYPIGYRSRFATRNFQGRLPEGWTVELYQNNALISVQKSRADGLYEFRDITLRFGLNLFRFVFLGPQGQRREENVRADIANDLPSPGSFYYRVAGVKPEQPRNTGSSSLDPERVDEAYRHAAFLGDVDYGLSSRLALNAGAAEATLLDGTHKYTVAGIRGLFPFLSLQGSSAWDRGPDGQAYQAREAVARTGYGYSSLSVRRSEYDDGFQKLLLPTGTVPRSVRTETAWDAFGTLPLGGHPVGLSLTRQDTVFTEGTRTQRDRLRATFNAGRYTISPSLSRTRDSGQTGPTPLDASVFVSSFAGDTAFQGELSGRRTGSKTELTSWETVWDLTRPSGLTYRIGAKGSNTKLKDATLITGVTKLEGRFGFGVDALYAKASGYSIAMRVQVSLGREPRTGTWLSQAQPMSGMGALSAVAFMDGNGNHRLDEGERILEGSRFKSGMSPIESAIEDPRTTFENSLPRAQEMSVQVDETSLEDPAMKSTVPAYRLVPRAGRVSRLDFPIAFFGEIVGTTRLRGADGTSDLGGLELELVKVNGEPVRTLRSAYDGFFEIRDIPLGEYLLRVSPREAARMKLKEPPVRTFVIDSTKNYFEGQDLVVEQVPAPAPPREESP